MSSDDDNVSPDLVAKWRVALPDGFREIEFEHGETTGKRIIRVNGEEVVRKDWLFSLIGSESFRLGGKHAVIKIDTEGLLFKYALSVDGKPLNSFIKDMNKQMRTWFPKISGQSHRVVIDTKTMDIYVDGIKATTEGEFVENGAENHFMIKDTPVYIKSFSSGVKRKGMLYTLAIGDKELEPVTEISPTTFDL